jgi:seryl-tRNA synthetase
MNYIARTPVGEPATQELFRSSGVDGVYGRTALFEQVIEGLGTLITRHREPDTEVLRFPPVISRATIEKAGYLHSFPNLIGAVSCLHGDETQIRAAVDRPAQDGGWTAALQATDLVLAPAACYHVYPLAAARGRVPAKGFAFDVACDCFRHEPSRNADRMQSFRMREYVCIGTPEQASAFRDRWIERGQKIADQLGLRHSIAPASDPFFGRAAKLMADSQIEQALKFELLIAVRSAEQPTACMSFNCHRDHFGTKYDLRGDDGHLSNTACAAFGMDRLALAMFATHGTDLRQWPQYVREAMSI